MSGGECLDTTDFANAATLSGNSMETLPIGSSLDEIELNAIKLALRRCGGNVSLAAEALGISRQSLYRRIEKYGLTT